MNGIGGILMVVIVAILVTGGCMNAAAPSPEAVPTAKITPAPLPSQVVVTETPRIELARLQVDQYGLDPTGGDVFEFTGKVSIGSGTYRSVMVIIRYSDGQEYSTDAGGMGGSNATIQPFFIYPGKHYLGQEPERIIQLDGRRYSTDYRYENGTLYWVAFADNILH